MTGSVQTELHDGIIMVTWRGPIDEHLLSEGQKQIRFFLTRSDTPRILHNTIEMDEPNTALALKMRAFDQEIMNRVCGIATVVNSSKTAVMAKISFAFSKKHQVYRHDIDMAKSWLRSCALH
ncbi:MAG: hypothetical protein C0624_06185 [Desulfuromonas sp.]|nr:MAG: hypothetical protein C0624_06185 [Desulfuromonas sp.]